MDRDTINSFLVKTSSNLRDTDVISAIGFLKQRGFKILRMLGCGSFGAVLLAEQQSNQEKVAIKIIYARNEEEINNFCQEFSIMTKLESQFTIKLIDILTDLKNKLFFLIMQYQPNGDLGAFISANPNLSSQQIAKIFIQILRGLIYLKENKIIHGDLKPQNILLSADNTPKLTDFGLSTKVLGTKSYNTNKGGTFWYQAPEQQKDQKVYFESDWYSAGMILFNLCGNNDFDQMYAIKGGYFPDIANIRCQNIVQLSYQMMSPSLKNRASPEQIIQKLKIIHQFYPSQTLDSQKQPPLSSQPQQQQKQLLLQQQQEQLQEGLQQKKILQQQQQQQEQQKQQEEQQLKQQHQKSQLQKQQKQQQQQQQIEQQQSTISKSAYFEYVSLIKQGVNQKILKKKDMEWEWSKWKRDELMREWMKYSMKDMDESEESDMEEEEYEYANTYEYWQDFEEEERQQQLRVLRKHVHHSN